MSCGSSAAISFSTIVPDDPTFSNEYLTRVSYAWSHSASGLTVTPASPEDGDVAKNSGSLLYTVTANVPGKYDLTVTVTATRQFKLKAESDWPVDNIDDTVTLSKTISFIFAKVDVNMGPKEETNADGTAATTPHEMDPGAFFKINTKGQGSTDENGVPTGVENCTSFSISIQPAAEFQQTPDLNQDPPLTEDELAEQLAAVKQITATISGSKVWCEYTEPSMDEDGYLLLDEEGNVIYETGLRLATVADLTWNPGDIGSKTFYLEKDAIGAGTALATLPLDFGCAADEAKYHVVNLDLVVNGLPEGDVAADDKDEDWPGAFIQDNSDFTQWQKNGRVGIPVPDKNKATIDPDDDRLVDATLSVVGGCSGNCTLVMGGKLRVWRGSGGGRDANNNPIPMQWTQIGYGENIPITGAGETIPLKIEGVNCSANWLDAELTASFIPDNAEGPVVQDSVKITVVDVKVTDLIPAADLILGDDLVVKYTISGPEMFLFDSVDLEVYNKLDELVFKKNGLSTFVGPGWDTKWEKAKWNQEPHLGAYANPNNGNYKIKIVAKTDACVMKSNDNTIKTKLVIEANIKDEKGGTATMASGLGDIGDALKVVVKKDVTIHTLSGASLTFASLDDGKLVRIDNETLNSLADGAWTIQLKDVRDEIGNFYGANLTTGHVDHYEWTINLH